MTPRFEPFESGKKFLFKVKNKNFKDKIKSQNKN